MNKFNCLSEDVASGVHDMDNAQFIVALSDTAPSAIFTNLSSIAEIDYSHVSSRELVKRDSGQTDGKYTYEVYDLQLTATGNVPQFRYIIVYNAAISGDRLIGWYDYGSGINMTSGFTIKFIFQNKELLTIE